MSIDVYVLPPPAQPCMRDTEHCNAFLIAYN